MDPRANIIPKACRNCRVRKVRCNREVPCSNCIISKISCHGQGNFRDAPRRSAVRERETIVNPCGNNLDELRDRVEVLEQQVKILSRNVVHSPNVSSVIPLQEQGNVDLASLEGESSFRKQALLAVNTTEIVSLAGGGSPQVSEKLSDLRKLLEDRILPEPPRTNGPKTHDGSASLQADMPPPEFVVRLIRELKGPDCLLILYCPISSFEQFEELCRDIYFPVQPASSGDISLLSAIVFILLSFYKDMPDQQFSKHEVEKYKSVTKEIFMAGAVTYETHMTPTFNHCLLLSLAALHAQTQGDLALQWKLSSAAARHCLALGYHRESIVAALPPAKADRVRRLFWHIYFSDKSLVLSLGRASTIQDIDVDVEPYPISDDPGRRPWDQSLFVFIKLAKLQTQIYESLYSPASRRRSGQERRVIVDTLAVRLADWRERWIQVHSDSSQAYQKLVFDNTFGPAEVMYYSTLTLLYRAVDLSGLPNTIVEPCYAAAKKGLEAYAEVHARYRLLGPETMAHFAVWVHIYSSLTPFVVTFLHSLTTPDNSDLHLLKSSLDILEQMSTLVDVCKRPYGFCKYLYSVAEAHFLARSEAVTNNPASPFTEGQFDKDSFFQEPDMQNFWCSFVGNDWWLHYEEQ